MNLKLKKSWLAITGGLVRICMKWSYLFTHITEMRTPPLQSTPPLLLDFMNNYSVPTICWMWMHWNCVCVCVWSVGRVTHNNSPSAWQNISVCVRKTHWINHKHICSCRSKSCVIYQQRNLPPQLYDMTRWLRQHYSIYERLMDYTGLETEYSSGYNYIYFYL